jgi:peroxiredoxin
MDFHTASTPAIIACGDLTPRWTSVYDAFVAKLRTSGVGEAAPRVGDVLPNFALPDHRGRYRKFAAVVADGPIVLSFNRGGWCPYCRAELEAWRGHANDLRKAGGRFVSVAAETGGRAEQLREFIGAGAEVLVDVDHGLALALGLAFRCDAELQARYLACGLDLADIYGNGGWLLPVPATFVVDRERRVRFAFVDPDFRHRADPGEVIASLRGLV